MKLAILSHICPEAVAELTTRHDVVCVWHEATGPALRLDCDCEALVFRSGVTIDASLMSQAPDLKLLIRAGAGLDNIDMEYIRARNIELISVPVPGGRAVAELTLGLMLMLARRIMVADQALRRGRWLKHDLDGCLLLGKCLGIVGAGRIGAQVGEIGAIFGMRVIGCVARPTPEKTAKLAAAGIELTDFDTVIRQADFVCIHVPLTAETKNLFDRDVLRRLKPGAFLLNLGRGGVVDEEALLASLTTPGGLAGAALDVHSREGEGQISVLAALPDVVLTPHVGSTTLETQREIGRQVVTAVETFAAGLHR